MSADFRFPSDFRLQASGRVLQSSGRPFLTANWHYLAMVNWRIDSSVLAPFVPAGTVLDRWHGDAIVSAVGFRFLDTRLLGVPIPGHRNFDEVNLRMYVRREVPGGEVRRAVTFIREFVPRRAIALVARLAYNEPYIAVPMRSTAPATLVDEPGPIDYAWQSGDRWHRLSVEPIGHPAPLEPHSDAEFITEHFWGYTAQRDGGTIEYQVAHPRWRLWPVTNANFDCDIAAVYGAQFLDALSAAPCSAFLAEGSPVTVFRPRRAV